MREGLQENGVLVVDKPAGISSAGVVHRVKKILGAGKVGHAGTLDPFATGVLICCLNRATRLADFFLKSRKVYQGTLVLGVSTDTQDCTGTVTETADIGSITEDEVRRVFRSYRGPIRQRPPVYSALKHRGVPLYRLARKGTPVRKPAREIHIDRLDILETAFPEIHFEAACSAGTYVRTLCADIGADLGCGGHLRELRRVRSGGFTIEDAISLDNLADRIQEGRHPIQLIGMADALYDMPACRADGELIRKIVTGKRLDADDLKNAASDLPVGFFKVVDAENRLVAVLDRKNDAARYDYRCVFPN